jgi:hypothetical protein
MKITITIEDSQLPFWHPFRTLDEYLEWHRQNDEYEQRRLEKQQGKWRWDWLTQNTNTF